MHWPRFPSNLRNNAASAPKPAPRKGLVCHQGQDRRSCDPYDWLRSRRWNEVLQDPQWLEPDIREHLLAENEFARQTLEPLESLRKEMAEEIGLARRGDWLANLRKRGDWLYGLALTDDRASPAFMRLHIPTGVSEILTDFASPPAGFAGERVVAAFPSTDFKYLACVIAEDGVGRHRILFIEPALNRLLKDRLDAASFNGVFDPNGERFFYTSVDRRGRRNAVWCHVIGTQQDSDQVIWEEADQRFSLTLRLGQSLEWLVILCRSYESTETLVLPVANIAAGPTSLWKRRPGQHVIGDTGGAAFFAMVSRDRDQPYELLAAPIFDAKTVPTIPASGWGVVARGDGRGEIASFLVQRHYLAWEIRDGASTMVRIQELSSGVIQDIDACGDGGVLSLAGSDDFESRLIPLRRISPGAPQTLEFFEPATGSVLQDHALAQRPAGGAPLLKYRDRQILVGEERIPVTLVGTAESMQVGGNACLLTAYGAYGVNHSTAFRPEWAPLLDRGFVCAIAHIRGGGEGGRLWHESAIRGRRYVAIGDFIAVAEALGERGIVRPGQIIAHGTSAGGVASFAAAERRPDLFCGLIGVAPFLDVLTTMLDLDLPLTREELDEWGNPQESDSQFDAMAAWCPYASMRKGRAPPTLILNALRDDKVPYWGAIKWTLRRRDLDEGQVQHVVVTHFDAGHAGRAAPIERDLDLGLVAAFAVSCAGEGSASVGR